MHHEAFLNSNIAATTADFTILLGGKYMFNVTATWGGGNVVLARKGPDNATYLTLHTALLANGGVVLDLPPGKYQVQVTTATAVYAELVRVPYT